VCVVYSRPVSDAQVLTVALLCVVYSRPVGDAQVLTVALSCVWSTVGLSVTLEYSL